MKKVFLIGPVLQPVGGVSIHIARLVKRIGSTHDIDCVVFDMGRFRFFDRNLKELNVFKAILFFLQSDIVHIHIANKLKVVVARISNFCRKKVVYTRHNIRIQEGKADQRLHSIADAAIHVSSTSFDKPDNKTFVIPAFIKADSITPLSTYLKAQLGKYEVVIAALSTHPENGPALVNGKDIYGFDLMLEAYKDSTDNSQLLLLLDPSGVMKHVYKPSIDMLNKSGSAVLYLTEEIDFCALTEYLTVYARPSRTDGDSIAIREALEAGVKVVASDCVERPVGVKLFKNENPKSLENVLQKVIASPKTAPESQPDFSKQILALYRNF